MVILGIGLFFLQIINKVLESDYQMPFFEKDNYVDVFATVFFQSFEKHFVNENYQILTKVDLLTERRWATQKLRVNVLFCERSQDFKPKGRQYIITLRNCSDALKGSQDICMCLQQRASSQEIIVN